MSASGMPRGKSVIPDAARQVGLVGAAVTDHPDIERLVAAVVATGRRVSLSSVRADRLTPELLALLKEGGARTLTLAADGAFRDQIPGLGVEEPLLPRPFAPPAVGDVNRLRGGTLHDRNELDPRRGELVAEEPVDAPSVPLVGGVDRAEDVEVDAVLAQALPALHH